MSEELSSLPLLGKADLIERRHHGAQHYRRGSDRLHRIKAEMVALQGIDHLARDGLRLIEVSCPPHATHAGVGVGGSGSGCQ